MADPEFSANIAASVMKAAETAIADAPQIPAQTVVTAHNPLWSLWETARPWFLAGVVGLGWMLFNLYRNQDSLLYHPVTPQVPFKRLDETPGPFGSPADSMWNLAYDEHYLTTLDNVRIHLWWIPAPADVDTASAPTIVYFHANALHMGFRLSLAKLMHDELQCNVVLSSYRGYGNSEGSPSERGLELDADAVLSWVTSQPGVDKRKLFLYGQSLGGAVAIQAAATGNYAPKVAGLIVENTFTSVSAMVDHLMPLVRVFKALILRIGWRSIDVIHRVTAPILFISGLRDELVPPSHVRQLHDAAVNADEKEIFVVAEGGHNDTLEKAGAVYFVRLRSFIERTLRRKLGPVEAQSRQASLDQKKQRAALLEEKRLLELARQSRLAALGKMSRWNLPAGSPAIVTAMPRTAGPGVSLDLPPGGEAVATMAHVHLTSDGVDNLGEGAVELMSEAAGDEHAIHARAVMEGLLSEERRSDSSNSGAEKEKKQAWEGIEGLRKRTREAGGEL